MEENKLFAKHQDTNSINIRYLLLSFGQLGRMLAMGCDKYYKKRFFSAGTEIFLLQYGMNS